MKKQRLFKIVLAAVLAAITYVATTFIRIPAPLGYINLGDCAVLLCGWLLGPAYGALAGGIGSALADLFGFPLYTPATLVIKSAMAFAAAVIGTRLSEKRPQKQAFALRALSALLSELLMVAGYFAYECFIYSPASALAAVPFNLIQGAAGVCSAVLLYESLRASGALARLFKR